MKAKMSRKEQHAAVIGEGFVVGFRKKLIARVLCAVGASAMIAQGCSSSPSPQSNGTGGKASSNASASSTSNASSSSSGEGGSRTASSTGGSDAGLDGAGGDAGDGGGLDAASGAGGAGGSTMATTRLCIPWPFIPPSDGGGAGGAGGAGGSTAASSTASSTSSSASGAGDAGVDAGPCPTDLTVALNDFLAENCPRGFEPKQVVDGPLMPEAPGACCYDTYIVLCGPGGRPFIDDDLVEGRIARTAARIVGAGWRADEVKPDVGALTPGVRDALASAWAEDALREHASVPAFARVALSLLALGAPADLVRETHEAALDEVRHAELSFGLSAAYAGAGVAPSGFPLGEAVTIAMTLEDLVVATIAEGCVGETIAAALAAEQLQTATDPAVRAVLAEIAEDEAAHAELAWRTRAWAVREGGAPIAAVARAAFATLARVEPMSTSSEIEGSDLETHGRLGAASMAAVAREVTRGLILPSAAFLLARTQDRSVGAVAAASAAA